MNSTRLKNMIMVKVLGCLAAFAILISVVAVSVVASEPTALRADSQDTISSLYDDFNVDTGRNLVSSSTWKFWTENSDKFNVKANTAVPDGKPKVLQLVFPGGNSLAGPIDGPNIETKSIVMGHIKLSLRRQHVSQMKVL
jgi:hypothetical protein